MNSALRKPVRGLDVVGATNSHPALLAFFVGPALDVTLEHAVLEALLFVDRLGNVMEGDDAEQRRAFLHRDITLVPLDHGAAQLHHVEVRRRDQRVAYVDLSDLEVAELPLTLL